MRVAPLLALSLLGTTFCGALGGCDEKPSAAQVEQRGQDAQMGQFLRNQPVPSFDWSLERHMLIALYAARQRATSTFSVVQSEYTGKILWSCASIGFPLPYAAQLTNPRQIVTTSQAAGIGNHFADGVVAQQEPNGLFTPAQSEATWVPCVDDQGQITPVYEEKRVTVFLRPMREQDGGLVPVPSAQASLTISPIRP